MEKSTAEKVLELEIEYGKWARGNLILNDNSILAYIYGVKMGKIDVTVPTYQWTRDGAYLTQEDFFNEIREYTREHPEHADWFIAASLWWEFFKEKKDISGDWFIPLNGMEVGQGINGFIVNKRRIVRAYGYPIKSVKINKDHFTIRLTNKSSFNVVPPEELKLVRGSWLDHRFTAFCKSVDKGVEEWVNERT